MNSLKSILLVFSMSLIFFSCTQKKEADKALYDFQKDFAEWRFGLFMHFEMGTYMDDEGWKNAYDTSCQVFNPTKLDCRQWAKAAKSAGMKFAVLTTKHHYGFSLWPTQYGNYNVNVSPLKRDIIREYVDAFRAEGLIPCFYFSIWDRHHRVGNPKLDWRHSGEPNEVDAEDIELIKGEITELLTNYGEIPMFIIDGWSWHMGQHTLPYAEIRAHIKSLQPNCLLIDHNGLSEQWGGDAIYFEEPKNVWAPADNSYPSVQGMTLTKGWFWHPDSPYELKMSVENIVDDHLKILEKRYCNFLLNVGVNRDGLLDSAVVERLAEIGQKWSPDNSRPALPKQPRQLLTAIHPSSASASSGNAFYAIDGINDIDGKGQAYQTLWQTSEEDKDQELTIDLGEIHEGIEMLRYLPRQDNEAGVFNTTGNITSYTIMHSVDGKDYKVACEGSWDKNKKAKQAIFKPIAARYIKLKNNDTGGITVVNEIMIGK